MIILPSPRLRALTIPPLSGLAEGVWFGVGAPAFNAEVCEKRTSFLVAAGLPAVARGSSEERSHDEGTC